MFRTRFGKWWSKAQGWLENKGLELERREESTNRSHEANNKYHAETLYMAARPVVDWVDPMEVEDFSAQGGIGSLAVLRRTEENPIVETKTDRLKWINSGADELSQFEQDMQKKIDAAFAGPLLKAVMWAIEGEMAKVTGKAQVESASWMEHTGEIDISPFLVAA